ncbi:MAG: pilin [Patescibacteria group bacterium]
MKTLNLKLKTSIVSILAVCFLLTLSPAPAHAATYRHCVGFGEGRCSAEVCGPFMCGITTKCQQFGDCSLRDIMIVVYNVGNFILAIVAGLVLLMYIIGGAFMLVSRGNQQQVTKGKNYIKYSTIGLIIVFCAYIGLTAIRRVLISGEVAQSIEQTQNIVT